VAGDDFICWDFPVLIGIPPRKLEWKEEIEMMDL
jgi:hypothetical protein